MPLLGNKPKQKEKPKENGDNVSPEQWIKNSGHSLKGIFLEWLSEQKLFAIIDGEIKRIKKENQRKKNMTPEDKLAWKRKAAKLSDETIAKFGKEYLGQNSAEETKEYIRNGLNTVANQIKTGNFYKKASLFGDEDMDKFMEDLEAEWDEDEFSSSGESFRKPYREFMSVNDMGKAFDKGVDKLYKMKYGMSQDEYFKKHFPEKPATKYDDHQYDYKVEKNSYDGTYSYTVHIDTPFPGHFNVTIKNKDAERPSATVKSILENMSKIEALWKKYISTPKFKKEFESEWESTKYTIDTEGEEWLDGVESEMELSGLAKDPMILKKDLWKYATDPEDVWLYYNEGEDKIRVVFGYYLEYVQQGFDWEVKLKDIGINSPKVESYRKPYREFMSTSTTDNRPTFTSKKLPNLERVVSKNGPHFFQDSYGPGKLQDDYDFEIFLHTDGPYDDVSDIQVELYNKLTKDKSFIKELEKTVAKEGVRDQKKNGVFTLYYIYNATIYPDGTMEVTPLYGYKDDEGDEYSDEGDPYVITTYKTKSKGESYFMKYKAMGEFSKGGSNKNVFTIGLGDIKRYEGLLKIYTSTKKSIRGFVNKVIKIANKDVNEAKEYANKNNVDSLLDKMSDADNNLLDEMSDLVKGKLEPKNLPVNVAKKMKSYLDKQHKVFNSYDMPEDLYNKWKEIYSSNESDPTMKAINNTARFFEPNTVNGSDYSKIFDKFKDFKVSVPTPAAEMMYLTQRESVLSNDDVEELSNAIDRYNAMKREYGPKLLKVMNTVMNNKEDLDQGEITIDDFDLEEFSASDASYDLEKAIKNIDAINFDKSDYTTKERLRQEFKHLMDVCDFEVIPRSDSEKWKKFSEDNYSSRFSSQYPDIVEFVDRELSYVEKDFLASKEFKNIYKRVGEAKLNDIINKSPIGENFIKRLGGKR